ncbi:hypothetical protein SDC9_77544 [bioreactor metagenome]|uniref:DUF885 domain-containing protein n=1 Tax=bioreactor metagenome TaxID=1076179 RepID=A0A644YSY9_9ZZZZ
MKQFPRFAALILALMLLTGVFSGCKLPDGNTQTVTLESGATASQDTSEATAAPTPGFQVSDEATSAYSALDLDVFRWYATMDGYSLHMFMDDPANFGVDPKSVNMTLGEFTAEDSVRLTQEAAVFLDRLNAINREQLPQNKQFSYDVLHDILTDYAMDGSDFYYLGEPLTEYSGLHSNLPLSFALFELKNTVDVEDYLTLLADMPRYMGQVLAFEQKRAEMGIFMTEDALNAILEDCKQIIDSRDNSFLYVTFDDAIDLLTDLTPEQAQAYKDRNASLIQNEYVNSYQTLYDGLSALRKYCRSYEEAATYSDLQKRFFEYSMQSAGNNSLSVEETLEMLKNEMTYLINDIVDIQTKNPGIYDERIELSSGNMQTDLDYLQSLIAPLLPELPEHNLTLADDPEELQSQFAPAAYVVPSLDDWKDNIIYINTATEDPALLLTLAHEGYPGHMYQYLYQRSNDDLGLMQRASDFSGYAEGWAQFAEFLVTQYQTQYDQEYVRFQFEYSAMQSSILPAILSIMVNYYGYSEEALGNYLSGIGLNKDNAHAYFTMVVDQPYYFFAYAVGYAQLAQLYRDESNDIGESFDMSAFLTTYLNLGPGNFDLIREQMDVWADGVLQDAA